MRYGSTWYVGGHQLKLCHEVSAEEPNQSVERTEASRFAHSKSVCQWRLASAAHAGRSAHGFLWAQQN